MADAEGSLDVRVEGLSGAQETALAALKGGGTFAKAAEEAGVNRTTLYRWVHGDPHFRAAYNVWQREAAESARARLVKLADVAVDVVEKALRRGDEKVALKVLRGMGALRKRRSGSTRPEVLDLQIQLRDKRELGNAERGMLHHLMKKMGMPARQRKHVIAGGRGTSAFLEGVQQELERRGSGPRESGHSDSDRPPAPSGASPGGSGDATSGEPRTEPIERSAAAEECDNPLPIGEMRLASGGREAAEGDASLDATPQGTLHGSVA
jgi:transposase-like protein